MKSLPLLNPENVSEEEAAMYKVRDAARAIVIDDVRMVALLHATKYNYYKLPGGGIEEGKDKLAALKRECREEIGCEIEVTGEVASLTEYRKQLSLNQTSYCYMAHVVGTKGQPTLETEEIEHGMETLWVSLPEARRLVRSSSLNVYEASYMVARDTALIDAAMRVMDGTMH